MNKGDLVDAIAAGSGLTKVDSEKALNATIAAITNALTKGDKVTVPGFGSFLTSKRAARTGRNPQSGKEIKIAARTVARFKVGKTLADAVAK
ncbi:MAG: HU family DNA-binding protein [Saprospiraceae bacterium]|jgi:DNA-binding protein HU-beta|nr:HU family DNA-binding protein [Saprospiraceae bacterium]MBL0191447.1 HU family DNA-binding protein [Saprospiraceae bacterium]MBL0295068.1 HU family DNA-binding protein [Saprospiraceae bacterium]